MVLRKPASQTLEARTKTGFPQKHFCTRIPAKPGLAGILVQKRYEAHLPAQLLASSVLCFSSEVSKVKIEKDEFGDELN
jgi:hypothetical protein